MAETRRAEIHSYGRWWYQIFSAALIRQEAEHEILKQPTRVREGDVGAMGGVGGLLEEYGVAGYFADVDGDGEALASEDSVHDGDVLVREVAGDGEDEDSRVQRCRLD